MDIKTVVRLLLGAVLAVYVGYALQPMPRVLNTMFQSSQLFKLAVVAGFILVNLLGASLKLENIVASVALAAVILSGFEYARTL
jgi:hypothetical protein